MDGNKMEICSQIEPLTLTRKLKNWRHCRRMLFSADIRWDEKDADLCLENNKTDWQKHVDQTTYMRKVLITNRHKHVVQTT